MQEKSTSILSQALQTHQEVVPWAAMAVLVLFFTAWVMRAGVKRRKATGNKTVSEAKLLIKTGYLKEAQSMLEEHLVKNPGDDRARSLLKQTR